MRDRLTKMERILAVQKRLHQMTEAEIGRLDRVRAELQAGQESLVEALNGDTAFHGLFVDAMARRLATLAKEQEAIGATRDAQAEILKAQALSAKRTERMTDGVRRAAREDERRKGFRDLLDLLSGRDASLP
jgi:hypothetical protein